MSFREDISRQIQGLRHGKKSLRNFGILFGTLFFAFSILSFLKHHAVWHGWLPAAAFFIAVSLIRPEAFRPLYRLWMTLSFVLGYFVSRFILIIVFYLVCTPISVILRLAGKDLLQLKKEDVRTYWTPKAKKTVDPMEYRRMY